MRFYLWAIVFGSSGAGAVEVASHADAHHRRTSLVRSEHGRQGASVQRVVDDSGQVAYLGEEAGSKKLADSQPVLHINGTDGNEQWRMRYDPSNYLFVNFLTDEEYYIEFVDRTKAASFLDGTFQEPVQMKQGVLEDWSDQGGMYLTRDGKVTDVNGADFHPNEARWSWDGANPSLQPSPSPPPATQEDGANPSPQPSPSPPPATQEERYFWAAAGERCPDGQEISEGPDACRNAVRIRQNGKQARVDVYHAVYNNEWPPGCFAFAHRVVASGTSQVYYLDISNPGFQGGRFRALCKCPQGQPCPADFG